MKNIVSVFAVAIFTISTQASAQNVDKPPSTQKITKDVLEVVNKYAEALGCPFEPAIAKNIAALTPVTSADGEGEFLAFWDGDIGCAGGSGTGASHAAFVVRTFSGHFYVDPTRSSPMIDLDFNTRFMERLVGNTKNTIVVDAKDFSGNDSNCCPTLRFRYTLQADKKGNWKTIEKKALPQKAN